MEMKKMIVEYIQEALKHANYEIIEDEDPYYGEIPQLKGVWASGKTLEECRQNLADVLDSWIVVRLRKGLHIPSLGKVKVEALKTKVYA